MRGRWRAGWGMLLAGAAMALLMAGCGSSSSGNTPVADDVVQVAQSPRTLEEGSRTSYSFECPSGHPYLQNWDAEFDPHISLLVGARTPNTIKVYARNAGANPESFTVSLECAAQAVAQDAVRTKMERIPAEASGGEVQ